MIRIVPKFTKDQLAKMIEGPAKEAIEAAVLSRLQFIGEQFVTLARTTNTYKDRTGNLRNSIGYIILKDGEQLFDNFQKSARIQIEISSGINAGKQKVSSGGADGIQRGLEIAKQIAQEHPRGFVLVGVAGMDYATAVEANGYDVLTGSAQIAEQLLREAFAKLQNKISKQ
jgi:hypothetical protein